MIKDIIEKMKSNIKCMELNKFRQDDNSLLDIRINSIKEFLPDLEKSALQEEALIKALVEHLKRECSYNISVSCEECNLNEPDEICLTKRDIQLLESITGKKWDEIKEVYR